MAIDYFLVCMECKDGVDLGELIPTKYSTYTKETFGFSGFGEFDGQNWIPSSRDIINLDHFLAIHRTHELRVLSEKARNFPMNIGFPHHYPDEDDDIDPKYSRNLFLEREVPPPDASKEYSEYSEELIEKLKKF